MEWEYFSYIEHDSKISQTKLGMQRGAVKSVAKSGIQTAKCSPMKVS